MSVMTKQDKINVLQGWVQHNHLTHLKNLELACKDDHIDAYEDVLFPMGWNTCDRCGALGDSELDFCWVEGFDWQDDNEDDQAILRAIGEEANQNDYCAICWHCINELKKKGKLTLVECEDCGEQWTEQELDSSAWHCPKCGNKIGD